MKIRIIGHNGSDKHSGIFGRDGEIEPGTEVTLNDDPPAAWKGKYEVVDKGAAKGATLIANTPPADLPALTGKNKVELLAIAKAENVTVEDGATNPDIVSAIELAREEKAKG